MSVPRGVKGKEKKSRQKLDWPFFVISDMDGTLSIGDASVEVLYELGRRIGAEEAREKGLEGKGAEAYAEKKGRGFVKVLERNWRSVDRGLIRRQEGYYPGMAVEKVFKDLIEAGYRFKRSELTEIAGEVVRLMPKARELFNRLQRSKFSERRMCYILTANAKPIAEAVAQKLGFSPQLANRNVYGFDFVTGEEGYITGVKDYWKNSKVFNNKKIERNMWKRILHRNGLGRAWAKGHDITPDNIAKLGIYLGDSITDVAVAKNREARGGKNIFLNLSKRVPREIVEYAIATSRLDVVFKYIKVLALKGPKGLEGLIRRKKWRRKKFPLLYPGGYWKEHVFTPRDDARALDQRAQRKHERTIETHKDVAASRTRRGRAWKSTSAFGGILIRNIPDTPAFVRRNVARPFRWGARQLRERRRPKG